MTGSSRPSSSPTMQGACLRATPWNQSTVDGHEGRILGFCGVPPAPQIEATVVVDKRAYLFTLFDCPEGGQRGGGSGVVRSVHDDDHARSRERRGLSEAEPFLIRSGHGFRRGPPLSPGTPPGRAR